MIHKPSRSSRTYERDLAQARREDYVLHLYVTDMTPKCALAFENLKHICEEHLAGRYRIEVVDVLEQPEKAKRDQILAIPTVVRWGPLAIRRVIGSLSDTQRVLTGLDLGPPKARAG